MKYTIYDSNKDGREIDFHSIWYHHNSKASAESLHKFSVELELANPKFRRIIESQTGKSLEDPELGKLIKDQFSRTSFNPIQWLLDIEDDDYVEREGKPTPWEIEWVFTDITRFQIEGDKILIEGNANPSTD